MFFSTRFGRGVMAGVLSASVFALTPAFAADSAKDPVVAEVDGTAILRSELETLRDEMARQMPQIQSMPMDVLFSGLVQRAVDGQLLKAAAKSSGLENDPEVLAQLEAIKAELAQRAFLERAVEKRLGDAEMKTAYEDFLKANPAEEEVHARHILVAEEDTAKAIIKKLDGGADFSKLAEEESTGPSGPRGGDLGYFTKTDMVPEFAEAAFGMKAGEYTKAPVKTQFGFHVIKVEDKRMSTPPTFDEVKEQLRAEKTQEAVSAVLEGLRADAKVTVYDIDGNPVKE